MKIPCKSCLLVPICRNKEYTPLMDDCSLICNLLYSHKMSDVRYRKEQWEENLKELERILQPTLWEIKTMDFTKTPFIKIIFHY